MSVRSQPAKQSAIVSRAALNRQRGAVERATALVVLFLSVLGTVAALYGGWGPIVARQFRAGPIAGGLALQGLLTWLQWSYQHRRRIRWPAIVVDAVFTAVGYGPLIVPWLAPQLAARGVPEPGYVAWTIVGLASLLPAWYPESRLVE